MASQAHIVIASYRENLLWVRDLALPCPLTLINAHCGAKWIEPHSVYSAGSSNSQTLYITGDLPCERVPNAGREAGQYLQFIIRHYDNLPPRMVFLQADMGVRFFTHLNFISERIAFLRALIELVERSPLPFGNLPAFVNTRKDARIVDEPLVPFPTQHPVFSRLFRDKLMPKTMLAGHWGGQFFVDRDLVRSQPVAYYQSIYDLHSVTNIGMDLEFHWPAVFNAPAPKHRVDEWEKSVQSDIMYNKDGHKY